MRPSVSAQSTLLSRLIALSHVKPKLIEALLDAAFGVNRTGRTAYQLRAGSAAIDTLSFAVMDGDALIGSIQCWPTCVASCKLILVGPVAVHPLHQNNGYGAQLMHRMLEAAAKIGNPPMVMIGDPEYYQRFGFHADATSGWSLPGPWEAHRLLARNVAGHLLPKSGMLERADAL
jgi:predicted N-acetyltransferase YhbS